MLRRTRVIVVFLLLGAIVNVAVAWGCRFVLSGDPTKIRVAPLGSPPGDTTLFMIDFKTETTMAGGWWRPVHRAKSPVDDFLLRPSRYRSGPPHQMELGAFYNSLHRSSSFRPVDDDSDKSDLNRSSLRSEYLAGWPCLSLRYRQYAAVPPPIVRENELLVLVGGVELPEPFSHMRHGLALPLEPIWSGLFLNSIFYGVLLWLLLAGRRMVRRVICRRRGICEKCAYPIGASPLCTECGHVHPTQIDAYRQ